MVAASSAVRSDQRFTRGRRCPICGGSGSDPRGAERRCHGFASEDGSYAHCSREEHAAGLAVVPSSATYAHRLRGPCGCGTTHGEGRDEFDAAEAVYTYRDENGALLFQVLRFAGKNFRQRRPGPDGGWEWSTSGTRRVLYRLPELLAAPADSMVFVVEGEKDADNLRQLGAVATTNPMGAGKWHFVAAGAAEVLRGRRVVVIPDDDEVGLAHAAEVAAALRSVAASVRVVALPAKDVSDWIAAGGTLSALNEIASRDEGNELVRAQPDSGRVTSIASGPIAIHVANGSDWAREQRLALADITAPTAGTTERMPIFDSADAVDLLARPDPTETPFLVENLITRGGIAMIGAQPKSAKTFVALEIAIAIATGTTALGGLQSQPGSAACLFAEDRERQVRSRSRSLLAGAGRVLRAGALHLVPCGHALDLATDEHAAWLLASCRKLGPLDLLVLDPLRDMSSAAEDSSDEMSRVMRRLRRIAELLSCTVLVVHHVGKSSADTAGRRTGQRLRGSSAIHGAIDSGMYMTSTPSDDGAAFDIAITSEIKGARSGGMFNVRLEIEDDEHGEAIRARWTRADGATSATADGREAADDARVLGHLRDLAARGESTSARALRDSGVLPDLRVRAAVKRLDDRRLISKVGSQLTLTPRGAS